MKKIKGLEIFTKWKGLLFVLPSLLGVSIFYILPAMQSVVYCFTSGIKERKFVGLTHFISLFNNQTYRLATSNTLFITGIALPLLCGLGIIIAILLEKNIHRYHFLQVALLIPMALPAAALMVWWHQLFDVNGVVSHLFHYELDWLRSTYAPFIIIGMIVWKNLGYNVLILTSALITMPKEYEEAASMDGAGFWKISLHIKVPHLLPSLFFTIILSLLNCFKIYREIYLLQGDYPDSHIFLLQHFMSNNFVNLNYDLLTTSAFILYMVIFIIISVLTKWQQAYVKSNVY